MTNASIAHASVRKGTGAWEVFFTMTKSGSGLLDQVEREDFHDVQAVVLNGAVVAIFTVLPSASHFTSFRGSVQMSVGSKAEANRIAQAMNGRT